MKKHLLFTLSGLMFTLICFSQVNLIKNGSFEYPKDSNNLAFKKADTSALLNKIKCGFNNLKGFYWRIDSCGDSGREDSTKFGYDATGVKQAEDGNFVAYTENIDPHIYQIVDTVSHESTQYTYSGYAQISYPDLDTTDARIYLSVFSGTDTMKRTILDSTNLMLISATPAWQPIKLVYTFPANSSYAGQHLCVEFGNYYSVSGTSSWTYFDNFSLTKQAGTGINSVSNITPSLSVYPNPSLTGLFNLTNVAPGTSYKVFDITGKLIIYSLTTSQGNNKIDLSKYGSGVYILQSNQTTVKLVVK
jgi:hypothetical protein